MKQANFLIITIINIFLMMNFSDIKGNKMIITIDGPSGSGKSTLAIKIAKHLNFMYLNSGYIYRGVAYVLKTYYNYDKNKLANPDVGDVQAILRGSAFRYVYQEGLAKIFWGTDDITFQLKDADISHCAVLIGKVSMVRDEIHMFEKKLIGNHDSVIEGRAIGTTLFPHAQVKFFLTATVQARAQRLQKDQIKRGNLMTLQEATDQITYRDQADQQRTVDPLTRPVNAIDLDSTNTNPEELLQQALNAIQTSMKNT